MKSTFSLRQVVKGYNGGSRKRSSGSSGTARPTPLTLQKQDKHATLTQHGPGVLNAYFVIPLREKEARYTRFRWRGIIYEYLTVMLGLGPSARIFTKLLATVIIFLRLRFAILIVAYIDDLLIQAADEQTCRLHAKITIQQTFPTEQWLHLLPTARFDLLWWAQKLYYNTSSSLVSRNVTMEIWTDASGLVRWGSHCTRGGQVQRQWTSTQLLWHNNLKEIMAAQFSLETLMKDRVIVNLHMDSQVAISFVNKMGGTRSRILCTAAVELWKWWCQGKDG